MYLHLLTGHSVLTDQMYQYFFPCILFYKILVTLNTFSVKLRGDKKFSYLFL